MSELYNPRREWARDSNAKPPVETLGSLFTNALASVPSRQLAAAQSSKGAR